MLPCVGDRIVNINNIPGDSLSAREAMRILETSSESVVLDVWRQSSPLNSAGSSPTPTSTGVNSPLPEAISASSPKSKSDTLAVRSSSWDCAGEGGRGAGSSKNLRSSGSQTDSLDSPGPSPRKALRNTEQEKVRHSVPMLDKAKEKVEKILRSRHRSQEREKEAEEKKDKHDGGVEESGGQLPPRGVGSGFEPGVNSSNSGGSKSQHKPVEDCSTQVNLPSTENVIAEFPNNTVYAQVGGASNPSPHGQPLAPPPPDLLSRVPKSPRKRELELDSNSGTWPKSRGQGQSSSGPPTVVFPPGHKPFKDRPSIRDVFYASPDVLGGGASLYEQRTVSTGPTIHHSSQNSDSSIKYPNTGFPPPP
ncbi:uncharacterized protein LOC106012976, partial [Aplysia californica]|uniref:Uncharacterized protein LOC106012976 n=1 Tax=Aplysia californica TaxID=6500 RepID=A0ABM1A8L4_APLCA